MSDEFLHEIKNISHHLKDITVELRQIKERLPSHRQLFTILIYQGLIIDNKAGVSIDAIKESIKVADIFIEELKRDPHQ